MQWSYMVGRWGVFKNYKDDEPIALLIDGTGVPLELGGPVFQIVRGRLIDSMGFGGHLAAFNEGWVENHGVNDLGKFLKRLS